LGNKFYLNFLVQNMKVAISKFPLSRFSFFLLILFLTGCATTQYGERSDVQQFIGQMTDKHNFDREQLTDLFNHVTPRKRVIASTSAPREALQWYNYRPIFVTTERAREGAQFWRQYASTLAYAQQRYGVPPEIIVAIIGVETRYGRYKGTHCVLDALSTLAFDYPRRATYFRSELENYLLLTRDAKLDPLTMKGSYAGAMGVPQFMPSSYRRYAVDANGKGYSDLINNHEDAILSVANYFNGYGWIPNAPVVASARITGVNYAKIPLQTNKPKETLAQFAHYGVYPRSAFPNDLNATLLTLEGNQGTEHWLGFNNFYVITRYNTSPLYAMAVYQLSQMIKAEYSRG